MFGEIAALSDCALIDAVGVLVKKEREASHLVVAHLAELERRRLFVELGYRSLFDYAVRGLGYSNAAAQRRVKAARAMVRCPEVGEHLAEGRMSLATAGLLDEVMDRGNAEELVAAVVGKSEQEVLHLIAPLRPLACRAALADRVVPVTVEKEDDRQKDMFGEEVRPEVNSDLIGNEETVYRVSFTAGAELKEKLDRVMELLPVGSSLDEVLSKMADEYLERHCPKRRHERRLKRLERVAERKRQRDEAGNENAAHCEKAANVAPSRCRDSAYVPQAMRDYVLARDGYCCQFRDHTGLVTCSARVDLQVDHVLPIALGGVSEPGNLRTLCGVHNRLVAKRLLGKELVERKIAERRSKTRENELEEQLLERLKVPPLYHFRPDLLNQRLLNEL